MNSQLIEILACPQCKGDVSVNDEVTTIICSHCKLAYPIVDGIPIMLKEKARKIT